MQQATTQRPDTVQDELKLCFFYQEDKCRYEDDECPFLHKLDPRYHLQRPCLDFRHNKCERAGCQYSHDIEPLSQDDEELDLLLQSFFAKVRRWRPSDSQLSRPKLAEAFGQALELVMRNNRCMEIAITRLATPGGLGRINELLWGAQGHVSTTGRTGPYYTILLRLFRILVIASSTIRPEGARILNYLLIHGSGGTRLIFEAVLAEQVYRLVEGNQEDLYTIISVLLLLGATSPVGRLNQLYEGVVESCETSMSYVLDQGNLAHAKALEVLRLLQQQVEQGQEMELVVRGRPSDDTTGELPDGGVRLP